MSQPNIDHYIGRATGREAAYRHEASLLKKQWEQATTTQHGVVIECGCGRARPMELMFRCFHCGLWFCDVCSPEHFGSENGQQHELQ
jgi:hypothetical protein